MRSVGVEATLLYDAPSIKAKKLFTVRKYTPLEVIISLEGMCKVREAEGVMAWVEKSHLSEKRTVVVTVAQAEMRQGPAAASALVATAEKWVAFELLEAPSGGWAHIKHKEGADGFVRINQVWGL